MGKMGSYSQIPLIIVVLLLLFAGLTGCLTAGQDSNDTAASSQTAATKQTADQLPAVELKHAVMPVSGMTCGSCEQAIQRSVGKLNGVSMVTASFSASRVEVDYDPQQVDEQAIIAAIERLQYKVEQTPSADENSEPAAMDEPQNQDEANDPEAEAADSTPPAESAADDAGDEAETADATSAETAAADDDDSSAAKNCAECDGECEGGEGCAATEKTQAAEEGGGGCAGCAKEAAGVSAPVSAPAGMERVTLKIEQMTCAGKSGWVNKTVGGLDGVNGCYADEGTLTAVIDFDPAKWDTAKLIEVINTGSDGFFAATEI